MIAIIHKTCRIVFVVQILFSATATWESTLLTGAIAFSFGYILIISFEIMKRFGLFQDG
jgi:hypothetical protein